MEVPVLQQIVSSIIIVVVLVIGSCTRHQKFTVHVLGGPGEHSGQNMHWVWSGSLAVDKFPNVFTPHSDENHDIRD